MITARPCPHLEEPENGFFNFVGPVPEYLTHSIVEFGCNEGYDLDHEINNVLICKADGTWSDEVPQCKAHDCEQGQCDIFHFNLMK